MLAEPLGARSGWLKDGAVLNNEDVSDVAIAVALLTSAVVTYYADNLAKVTELVSTIRELEDRLLARTLEAGDLRMQ
jgi:hypothetical protein